MNECFAYNAKVKDWFSFNFTEDYKKKQYMPVTIKTPYTVDRTANGVCLPFNYVGTNSETEVGYTGTDPKVLWRFPVDCYPSRLYIKTYFTIENNRNGTFNILIRDRKTRSAERIFNFQKLWDSKANSNSKTYTYAGNSSYDGYHDIRNNKHLTSLGNYEGWRTFDLKYKPYKKWDKPSEILIRFPFKTIDFNDGNNPRQYARFYLNELVMEF